jgi:putative sterol carrier protein
VTTENEDLQVEEITDAELESEEDLDISHDGDSSDEERKAESSEDEPPSGSELYRFIRKKVRERRFDRRRANIALSGVIEMSVNTGAEIESFFLSWRGDQVELIEPRQEEPDCKISLTEQNLRRIAEGRLNPQIAICAGKVRLEGRGDSFVELGMYSFNLFQSS